MYQTINNKDLKYILNEKSFISDYDFSFNNMADINLNYYQFVNCKFPEIKNKELKNCSFIDCTFIGLGNVYFKNSEFCNCDFRHIIIEDVKFEKCELSLCDFYNSKIYGDFSFINCNFSSTNAFLSLRCPEEGSFIGYKKILNGTTYTNSNGVPFLIKRKDRFFCGDEFLVKLLIPEDAKRSSATTNKCRCSKAKVLEITDIATGKKFNEAINTSIMPTLYKVGKFVYPDSFDENRWNECSHGIHFYITKLEALNHEL